MKIGVLGTAMVGEAIAPKLVALGHEVTMGSRAANNPKAAAWAARAGKLARVGTFAEAAELARIVFNCTHGGSSLEALRAAGAPRLNGKIVIDVANILPPEGAGAESLGERLQNVFPQAKVVKTLNTVNCQVMVDPGLVPGPHTLFMSGNDAAAKKEVRELLTAFGWRDVIDLGDIATSRASESYMPLWMALWKALGTERFDINIAR